jgi:hypothetical protein
MGPVNGKRDINHKQLVEHLITNPGKFLQLSLPVYLARKLSQVRDTKIKKFSKSPVCEKLFYR